MCEACDRDLNAFINMVDYMKEYRTEPEISLAVFEEDTTWVLQVAKVGGGTPGRTYPQGEQWIVNVYDDGDLMSSRVVVADTAKNHLQIITDFAETEFGF